MDAYPWTSAFRSTHRLPISATFDTSQTRFKDKQPLPSVDRSVSICGPIDTVRIDQNKRETLESPIENAVVGWEMIESIGLDIVAIAFLGRQMPTSSSA